MSDSFRRTTCALVALVTALSPISASLASAQEYPPPPPAQGYQEGEAPPPGYLEPSPGQDEQEPSQAYQEDDASPPQDYQEDDAPPPGYDGSEAPPPPPGYQADQSDAAQRDQDRHYEAYAEDWSQRTGVKASSTATTGAGIGGLCGA